MRTRKSALTEGIIAGILFGSAAILIRFLQDLDSFSIAFWRLVIACLSLGAIVMIFGKSFKLSLIKGNVKELVFLGFFLALHFIFFVSAVKDTTILNATVLVNTTPLFSTFVSAFFYKLKPSRTAVFGLTVSFLGICVIGLAETANVSGDPVQVGLKGDIEALLAAVVEAFYLNYGRKVRSRMNLLSTMLPIYVFTAIFVATFSVPIIGKIQIPPLNLQYVLPLIGLGLFPTAIAHSLYFSSLSNLKSFETATMALLEPIGATILGAILFQEIPAPLFVAGATSILIGILFVIRKS